MVIQNAVLWPIWTIIILAVGYFLYREHRKPRDTTYRVKVKFHRGIQTKLTLNSEQWEQFRAWLNSADGIYEIGDGSNMAWMDRRHVVGVEMKKR